MAKVYDLTVVKGVVVTIAWNMPGWYALRQGFILYMSTAAPNF